MIKQNMITLNNLELYKKKIINYIQDEILKTPSPKDILKLNGELVDSFSGKGLIKKGSVTLTDDGVATGFSNTSNTIATNVTSAMLKDGFEFNVKARSSIYPELAQIFVSDTCNLEKFRFEFTPTNAVVWSFANSTSNGLKEFGRIRCSDYGETKFEPNKWYIYNIKLSPEICIATLMDENYNIICQKESSGGALYSNTSGTIHIGRPLKGDYQAPYITVDLSETWFKDNNGNLISQWN